MLQNLPNIYDSMINAHLVQPETKCKNLIFKDQPDINTLKPQKHLTYIFYGHCLGDSINSSLWIKDDVYLKTSDCTNVCAKMLWSSARYILNKTLITWV